jgi:cobalt/nickel transport system permease protein
MDQPFAQVRSPVHSLDPRARILAAVLFAGMVAATDRLFVSLAGLAAGALAAGLARLPAKRLAARLAGVNLLAVLLWLFVPFSVSGDPVGPWGVTREGLALTAQVTLKVNALALALTALLSTIEMTALGHALHHLRCPDKLVHLYLFTVRYFHVIHAETRRLLDGMKLRGWRPGLDRLTWRAVGCLVGMTLVRSLDRAERVFDAMKCRCFQGRFHVLRHFRFARRDATFAALWLAVLALLGWLQWTPATH